MPEKQMQKTMTSIRTSEKKKSADTYHKESAPTIMALTDPKMYSDSTRHSSKRKPRV